MRKLRKFMFEMFTECEERDEAQQRPSTKRRKGKKGQKTEILITSWDLILSSQIPAGSPGLNFF